MWEYKGKEFNVVPPGSYYGFVYRIIELDEITLKPIKYYIGMKSFWSNKSVAKGKRELAADNAARKLRGVGGRVASKKKVTKESDWRNYYGSNKELLGKIEACGTQYFKREIIELCATKKTTQYVENYYLYSLQVLRYPDKFYNANISGTYFTEEIMSHYNEKPGM